MIRITELALPLDHTPDDLRQAILERLRIHDADLLDFTVFKRSYDARKKGSEIKFVYIIDANARHIDQLLQRFVSDTPWLHMDLSASSHKDGLGAVDSDITGFGVSWAIELLKSV